MATAKKTATTEEEVVDKVEETATEDVVLDNELDRLIPVPGEPIKLSDGTYVLIRPMKVKELFAAFKIITRGAAMSMGALSMNVLNQQDQFAETLIALLINAIPEADEEFAEFLRIVVDPVPPKDGWTDRDAHLAAELHLDQLLLEDPEIDDAMDIVTAVVYAESRDIERLGKKLRNAIQLFTKVTPKTPQK